MRLSLKSRQNEELTRFSASLGNKAFNRSKQDQLKSAANLRIFACLSQKGSVRFIACSIEDKEANSNLHNHKLRERAIIKDYNYTTKMFEILKQKHSPK